MRRSPPSRRHFEESTGVSCKFVFWRQAWTLFLLERFLFSKRAISGAMQSLTSVVAIAFVSATAGCVPPAPGADEPPSVESSAPVDEGGIPWAAGEAPQDASSTTRQAPDPEPEERVIVDEQGRDGLQLQGAAHACSGKAPPALRAAFQVRAGETRECKKFVSSSAESEGGSLRVSVRIETNGTVSTVKLLEDHLEIPEVTQCVRDIFQESFADKPQGGCSVFVVPLEFTGAAVETPSVSKSETSSAQPPAEKSEQAEISPDDASH